MGHLKPNSTPGRSEMSHGRGRYPDPRSDFQSNRNLVFPQGDDENDLVMAYQASLRTDATVPDDVIMPDMLYVKGNPDAFGPGPELVQEKPNLPRGGYPQPFLRYGVIRDD